MKTETSLLLLVSYVEERPWWPIQSPNKGRRKKEESERLRVERDYIKSIDLRFEIWQVVPKFLLRSIKQAGT